jgi:glycosyltransferase involved in cell wall biosynthesis
MTILQLNGRPIQSGGSKQAFLLAAELRRRGHRVLFVTRAHPDWEPLCRQADIELHFLPLKHRLDMRSVSLLAQLIQQEKVQVVHVHKGKEHTIAFWASFLIAIPVFVANRGVSFPTTIWNRWKYRYRLDATVAVSEAVRTNLIAEGVPAEKVVTIYGGVDVSRFHPRVSGQRIREELGIPDEARIVTKVAHILPWKGHETFLHAAALVRKEMPEVYFLCPGKTNTAMQPGLLTLAEQLHLSDHVLWLGFRSDIPEILAASAVSVNASHAGEGLNGALRESLAMARPVVATDVAGNREIVISEETGILVPPHYPEALAAGILRFLRDPQWAQTVGEQGRKLVEGQFSTARKAESMEELYWHIWQSKKSLSIHDSCSM